MYVSARAVPQRGVKAVFYHVRRAHNGLARGGKWTAAEDEQLQKYDFCINMSTITRPPPQSCPDTWKQLGCCRRLSAAHTRRL